MGLRLLDLGLGLDDVDAEVSEIRRDVGFGAYAGHDLAAHGGGVKVPRLRERVIVLGADPRRRERAVWWQSKTTRPT